MVGLALVGVVSVGAGLAVYALARRRGPRAAGATAVEVADRVVEVPPARAALRHDAVTPETVTGAGLMAVAVAVVITGLVVGILAYVIRRNPSFLSVDEVVERWAEAVATPTSDAVLRGLTHLGDTIVVIAVGLAVASWVAVRHRTAAAFAFLAVVIAGQALIANAIKVGVARARPALSPRAGYSGESFPSGHAATAAACFAAFALVLAIGRAPRARAVLMAAAVSVGVAVAGTRVLLGVHWTSDMVAGLAIGWSWYLVCAAAFGGRMLRYGAPVRAAAARASDGEIGSERADEVRAMSRRT